MDGLFEMTAAGVPIKLAGDVYHLRPLRLLDWAEASRYINQRRKAPTEVLKEMLPLLDADGRNTAIELAWKESRTADFLQAHEIERWFNTPEGQVYKFWLQLRQAHPALTLEQVDDLWRRTQLDELTALERQRSTDMGHEAGFPTPSAKTRETQAASGSPSRGEESSESLANGTGSLLAT